MAQLYAQVIEPAGNTARVGPETAASFFKVAAARIAYTRAGTAYVDTLPAGARATLWGGSATTVDVTKSPYVLFTTPRNGGTASLWMARQADWGSIWPGTDVVPLEWHDLMRPRRWQIAQGDSASGGGRFGAFDSQSASGGGSVSGLTYYYAGNGASGASVVSSIGLFLKVAAAPARDTAIFDFDGGVSGFVRLRLTTALHLLAEWSLPSPGFGVYSGSLDLFSGPISTNTWYWVSLGENAQFNGGSTNFMVGICSGPGGSGPGALSATLMPVSHGGQLSLPVTLGVGVATSTSLDPFPNSAGWEWSKVHVQEISFSGGGILGTPTVDVNSGDVAYMCRQTLGATPTVIDTSGNARNLAAGSQGLTIVQDGPYP